jgi:hypothetical protein
LISGFRRDVDEICTSETSVNNYHTTPRNIPEERRSDQRASKLNKFKIVHTKSCFSSREAQKDQVKVKVALEQAMKAQKGSRGIALLFL